MSENTELQTHEASGVNRFDNFDFLVNDENKNSDYGEILYDRAKQVEELYISDFGQAVANSSRLFLECFVQILCELLEIKPIKDEKYETIKYADTLYIIGLRCNIKQSVMEIMSKLRKICNNGSHYEYYKDENIKQLNSNNKELLKDIHKLCLWFYNEYLSKNRQDLKRDYFLPNRNQNKYSSSYISELQTNYELLKTEYNELKQECDDQTNVINKLHKLFDNVGRLKEVNISIGNKYSALKDEKTKIECDLDKYTKGYSQLKDMYLKLKEKYLLLSKNQTNNSNNQTIDSDIKSLVYEVIKAMNKRKAWATKNTILDFINGVSKPITSSYHLKEEQLWGIRKNNNATFYEVNNEIRNLILEEKIKNDPKKDNTYILV